MRTKDGPTRVEARGSSVVEEPRLLGVADPREQRRRHEDPDDHEVRDKPQHGDKRNTREHADLVELPVTIQHRFSPPRHRKPVTKGSEDPVITRMTHKYISNLF